MGFVPKGFSVLDDHCLSFSILYMIQFPAKIENALAGQLGSIQAFIS